MTLRPYQREAFEAINRAFQEFTKVLLVAPTGSGKTILFAHLAHERLMRHPSQRTLILTHREELVEQAVDKLKTATGLVADVEKAERWASLSAGIVVGSVQTLMTERGRRWPAGHFGLVVCDEAHHAISASWQRVLGHIGTNGTHVLGVTATPDRGDKKNLGKYFETIAAEISLLDLIRDGYLARIVVKSVPIQIDLRRVRTTAGDFNEADLGSALDPYLPQLAQAIREHASFRRVLVFVPLIATSHKFVAAARDAGLVAEHIDGTSPDRAERLRRFSAGEFDVLSNAMLLTEGYDDPGIDCVVVLRPTRSRPLFAQMVGRGTRTDATKENLLLLDFLWLHEEHELVHPAHLIAQTADQAKAMTDAMAGGGDHDLLEVDRDVQALRERQLRERLEKHRGRATKTISADEFVLMHRQPALADWEPTMAWESQAATEKQLGVLTRAKVDGSTVRNRGHASKLIDLYFRVSATERASVSQQRLMAQMGHPDPANATAGEARRFFARLRSNGGVAPRGFVRMA
jgi:superfamily II DNA or RNA helicase